MVSKFVQFPNCDGSHVKHNQATEDNVGPLIIQKEWCWIILCLRWQCTIGLVKQIRHLYLPYQAHIRTMCSKCGWCKTPCGSAPPATVLRLWVLQLKSDSCLTAALSMYGVGFWCKCTAETAVAEPPILVSCVIDWQWQNGQFWALCQHEEEDEEANLY